MAELQQIEVEVDDGAVDPELARLLQQGGELLGSGKVAEAKEPLERAYRLQPKNQKAQNLLGLTYFKLGTFDRASEIYEILVRENPVDPTLRVNLGLVYLKFNALQRAIREFETAVDLAPDHKKAQNYLGLAYAQAGDFARAKDCFVAAGSLTMAEKMERALKEQGAPAVAPPPAAVASVPLPLPASARPPPPPTEVEEVDVEVEPAEEPPARAPILLERKTKELFATPAAAAASAPERSGVEAREASTRIGGVPAVAEPWTAAPLSSVVSVPVLRDLTRRIAFPPPRSVSPFEVTADAIQVRVQGEMLCRLDGLLAASGALSFRGEMKRFRGRATDKAFGDSARMVVRVSGTGSLTIAPKGRFFVTAELGDESAYFREDVLFAFEEAIAFENGRVPSKIAPDLHLVHLRGQGKVLLCTPAPIWSVEVTGGMPCSLPIPVLVGWHGNLTPRIAGILQEGEERAMVAAVELAGEGFAILTGIKETPD